MPMRKQVKKRYRQSTSLLRNSLMAILLVLLLTVFRSTLNVKSASVTGAPEKLKVTAGVLIVNTGAASDSILELGNAGRDIVSTGDIYFRPDNTSAGLRFSGNTTDNTQDLLVTGDLSVGRNICLGGVCQSAWPSTIDLWETVTNAGFTYLQPKQDAGINPAIQIGDPVKFCAIDGNECTYSGDCRQENCIANSCEQSGGYCEDYTWCPNLACTGAGGVSGKNALEVYGRTTGSALQSGAGYTFFGEFDEAGNPIPGSGNVRVSGILDVNKRDVNWLFNDISNRSSLKRLAAGVDVFTKAFHYLNNDPSPFEMPTEIDADTLIAEAATPFTNPSTKKKDFFWKKKDVTSQSEGYTYHYDALCVASDYTNLCQGGTASGNPCVTPAQVTACTNGGGTCKTLCKNEQQLCKAEMAGRCAAGSGKDIGLGYNVDFENFPCNPAENGPLPGGLNPACGTGTCTTSSCPSGYNNCSPPIVSGECQRLASNGGITLTGRTCRSSNDCQSTTNPLDNWYPGEICVFGKLFVYEPGAGAVSCQNSEQTYGSASCEYKCKQTNTADWYNNIPGVYPACTGQDQCTSLNPDDINIYRTSGYCTWRNSYPQDRTGQRWFCDCVLHESLPYTTTTTGSGGDLCTNRFFREQLPITAVSPP
ncbi:MAG: hypothetical protein HY420_02980 [Candidatus Kerfeldbacteria bacterium]|nr:hypothetical protein [Candidatus Kerfeldbacteria bacterium]